MTKNLYVFLVLAVLMACRVRAALVNPDFEEYGKDGKLVGWYLPDKFTADRHCGSNGAGGIYYSNDDPKYQQYAQQSVPCEEGTVYQFGSWVKAENVSGKGPCFVCIGFYDSKGKWISESWSSDLRKSTNGEWVKLTGFSRPAPKGTVKATFSLCVNANLRGTFTFDKVFMEKYVREPVVAVYTSSYRNEAFDGDAVFGAVLTPEAFGVPAAEVKAEFEVKQPDGTSFTVPGTMPVAAQARAVIPVSRFQTGQSEVTCRLRVKGKSIGQAVTPFTRLEKPVDRKVYIDRYGRTVVNGKLFFPYGMYTGRTFFKGDNLKRYCEAPFTVFMQYGHASKEELDRCAKAGIYDIYNVAAWYTTPDKGMGTVSRMVKIGRKHPAVLAWYMFDEQATSMIPLLKERYEYLCREDPNHPVWCAQDIPSEMRFYMGAMDVSGCDPYPVSRKPVSMATDWIREENAQLMGMRPVWQVVQYFGWNWHDPNQSAQRRPTEAEVRNMTWQALAGGARGLIYYSYSYLCDKDELCGEKTADLWAEMKRVATEVRRHERVLLFAETAAIPDSELPKGVVGRVFRENGESWRLLVNTTEQTVAELNLKPLDVRMERVD